MTGLAALDMGSHLVSCRTEAPRHFVISPQPQRLRMILPMNQSGQPIADLPMGARNDLLTAPSTQGLGDA
jgi:hypothetical protein